MASAWHCSGGGASPDHRLRPDLSGYPATFLQNVFAAIAAAARQSCRQVMAGLACSDTAVLESELAVVEAQNRRLRQLCTAISDKVS